MAVTAEESKFLLQIFQYLMQYASDRVNDGIRTHVNNALAVNNEAMAFNLNAIVEHHFNRLNDNFSDVIQTIMPMRSAPPPPPPPHPPPPAKQPAKISKSKMAMTLSRMSKKLTKREKCPAALAGAGRGGVRRRRKQPATAPVRQDNLAKMVDKPPPHIVEQESLEEIVKKVRKQREDSKKYRRQREQAAKMRQKRESGGAGGGGGGQLETVEPNPEPNLEEGVEEEETNAIMKEVMPQPSDLEMSAAVMDIPRGTQEMSYEEVDPSSQDGHSMYHMPTL